MNSRAGARSAIVGGFREMPQRLHYGWIVAAVTFVVMMVGAGVRAIV